MSIDQPELKKTLGLFRLTVYGVGTIIGAGIYSVIAPATALAGAAIWLSFLLAAVAASFSAFSYAELASAFPSAGGEHNFLRNAFPNAPAAAFLVGLFIALHGAATLATVALTFAQYARQFVAFEISIVAAILLIVATLINLSGLKHASWVNVIFTCVQISGLLLLAYAGFTSDNFIPAVSATMSETGNITGVLGATAVVFFIYTGYEHMASLTEEVREPERNIWKAFILSLIISSVVYLLIIFSLMALTSPKEVAGSISPLADAAKTRHPFLGIAITVAALLATANAVLSGSISVSRLLFGMARAGDLPTLLTRTRATQSSPWIAALLVMLGAGIFLLLGELKFVASLSSLGALLVFTAINIAVIALRISKPDLPRPFRVPGAIGAVPILPILGVIVSVALALQYEARVYLTFGAGGIIGLVAYLIARRRDKDGKRHESDPLIPPLESSHNH